MRGVDREKGFHVKLSNTKLIHAELVAKFMDFLAAQGEDVGQISSHELNFPIVAADGEEGWVEIVIKVPKDESDEGYLKRESYQVALAEKAAKDEAKRLAKEKKVAADAKRRAEKRAALEAAANKGE